MSSVEMKRVGVGDPSFGLDDPSHLTLTPRVRSNFASELACGGRCRDSSPSFLRSLQTEDAVQSVFTEVFSLTAPLSDAVVTFLEKLSAFESPVLQPHRQTIPRNCSGKRSVVFTDVLMPASTPKARSVDAGAKRLRSVRTSSYCEPSVHHFASKLLLCHHILGQL